MTLARRSRACAFQSVTAPSDALPTTRANFASTPLVA
jgi:hypothetical protein